jgi:carboxylesterase type B
VVIFGESAGAMSVDALLTSYSRKERPPFSGAILQSGQVSYEASPRNPQTSIDAWNKLATELKCTGNDTLTCLQSPDIKASQIKEVIENHSLVFSPVFDNKTLISNPALRRSMGNIAQVPVMIGTNSQEGRVFVRGQDNLQAYLNKTFKNETTMIRTLADAYPVGKEGLETPYDAIAQIVTELTFQCVSDRHDNTRADIPQSAALWANTSAAVGIPTWRYYVSLSYLVGLY